MDVNSTQEFVLTKEEEDGRQTWTKSSGITKSTSCQTVLWAAEWGNEEKQIEKLPPANLQLRWNVCSTQFYPRKSCEHLRRVRIQEYIHAGTRNVWAHRYALCCICGRLTSTPHDHLLQVISRRALSFWLAIWCTLRQEWIRLDCFRIVFEMDLKNISH